MKRLEVDDIHKLANFLFPDDGDLALFNLVVDVSTGKLPYEVIDGPPEVVADEDTDIAVAMALVSVGQRPCRISWVFDSDHTEQRDILMRLVRSLKPAPQPLSLNLPRPPFTVAALIACEGLDGRFAYALFRHPGIDHQQAMILLEGCFPDEENSDAQTTFKN